MNIVKSLTHGAVTLGFCFVGLAALYIVPSNVLAAGLGGFVGVAFYLGREIAQHQMNDNTTPTGQTIADVAVPVAVAAAFTVVVLLIT